MTKIFIFFLGIFLIYLGFNKIGTSTDLNKFSIQNIEKYLPPDEDYFNISKGKCMYILYEEDVLSGRITEIVYPLFSQKLIDSFYDSYTQVAGDFDTTSEKFTQWMMDNDNIKPSVYVKANIESVSKDSLQRFMEIVDGIDIVGCRIGGFDDLSEQIQTKLPPGVSVDNTLFIEEGTTPSENKFFGWFMLILGIIMSLLSGISILKFFKQK